MRGNSLPVPRLLVFGNTSPSGFADPEYLPETFNLFICRAVDMSDPRTVRWGVLGTARIATKVSSAINSTPGAELLAIGSRSLDRANQWAQQHGASQSYASYQEVLEDDRVDAVYIPLPPSMHYEWTLKAAEHGKHILCEKPLAVSANQAAEMAAACQQHDRQLMDAVMWVHHPRATAMKAALTDGTLGTLKRVTSAFSFHMENWLQRPENQLPGTSQQITTLEEAIPYELRLQRDLGGGALGDLGWYCVRASLWAFDELPQRVLATARFFNNVDFNLSGLMWFSHDRVASFDCGYDQVWRKWFEVTGTDGSLVCDDFVNPRDPQKPRYWIHNAALESQEHVTATPIQEQCMVEHFSTAIAQGQRNTQWPTIAVNTQRVCSALDESARTERIIELR
jgi:predicted dehydrogenase